MNIDFEFILVVAVLISGVIWLVDRFVMAPEREESNKKRRADKQKKEPVIVEYARAFFPVLLIVLLLRSFVVEPFRIPSGSMIPTLHVGDFILVNKFKYGLRLPVLDTKVLSVDEPKRGDVMVFRYPLNPKIDYIKRVIGLPGDNIRYFNKKLYINGVEAKQSLIGPYDTECIGAPGSAAFKLSEKLPRVEHNIILCEDRRDLPFEYTVPQGQYFVMGDNRDNSSDSRVWKTVPEANLVGKAFMIWMSWDSSREGLGFSNIVWKRIGKMIE